jgi:hypothetical protein
MFDNIIKTIHSSARVIGDNDILAAGDLTNMDSFSLDNPVIEYGAGLLTPLCFMFLVVLFWTIICCVGCCVDFKCFKNQALVPAMIVTGISFVVFLSLSTWGVSLTTEGVDNMWKEINGLLDIVTSVLGYTSNIITHLGSGETLLGVASTVCLEGQPSGTHTFPSLTADIDQMKATIQNVNDSMEPVRDFMKDLESDFDSYIQIVTTSVTALSIVLYLTVVFFVGTSTVRAYRPNWGMNRFLNKTVSIVVLTVGIIVILLLAVVSCVIAAAALAGSDVCIPGVDATTNGVITNMDSTVTPATFCSTSPYDLFCYYQTCEGGDPLAQDYTSIETAQIDLQNAIQAIIDSVPGALPDRETCVAQLEATKSKFGDIGIELLYIRGSLSCTMLNPALRNLMDNTLCQQLIKGSAVVYVMTYTAVITFLAMLSVQFLLDFNDYNALGGKVAPGDEVVLLNDDF